MAEAGHQEGEAKKSSKKLLIIIIAALVVLGGGGAAAYFLLFKGDAKESSAEGSSHGEEAGEEAEDMHAEPIYYDMEKPPLIVNFGKSSSIRVVQIGMSVLLKGEGSAEGMKKHEPMVRNNLLLVISAQGADSLKTREGKEQLRESMKHSLEEIFKKMSIKGHVENLFFTTFVMQ